MQIKVVCSYCKEEFTAGGNGVEVLQRDVRSNNDGKVFTITYFHCPKCNCEHIVQMDDEYTKDLLKQTTNMMKAKILLGRVGKNINERMKKQFKQERALLTEYRTGLMAKYNKTEFIEEETGAEFELDCISCFTDKGGDDNEH